MKNDIEEIGSRWKWTSANCILEISDNAGKNLRTITRQVGNTLHTIGKTNESLYSPGEYASQANVKLLLANVKLLFGQESE